MIAIIYLDLYKPPISFIEVLGLVRLRPESDEIFLYS